MKVTYRILIVIILLSSNINFAQKNNLNFLNGMKYAFYSGPSELEYIANNAINGLGLVALPKDINQWPEEAKTSPCLNSQWRTIINSAFGSGAKCNLQILDCLNVVLYDETNTASGFGASFEKNVNVASNRAFDNFKHFKYSYNKSITKTIAYPEVENISMDENELKSYFDSTKLDPIEGIYKTYKSDSNYKLGIIKVADKFKAIIIESNLPQWRKGDIKIVFESTAAEGVFSIKYYMADKTSIETFANSIGGLITVELKNQTGENDDIKLLKLYPKN
jgi:hypothetical protein